MFWRVPCVTLLPLAAATAATAQLYRPARCEAVQQQHAQAGVTADSDAKLKLVQVVFRHGARTPLTNRYHGDQVWDVCGHAFDTVRLQIRSLDGGPQPVSSHDQAQRNIKLPGGCSKGELTKLGKQQSLEFGEWLRKRYVEDFGYLPSHFQEGTVNARTTNFSRTISTLEGVLTGLYPKTEQAIPAFTASDMDEILFANVLGCERLADVMQEAKHQLREDRDKDESIKHLVQQIRQVLGLQPDDRIAFADLHDAMTVIQSHDKPLPEGMTQEMLAGINKEATKRMTAIVAPQAHLTNSEVMLKMSMGRLFSSIVERMHEAAQGTPKDKLYLYSGHDTTIMPLLVTMTRQEIEWWPPYVSNLIFELWERGSGKQKEHYVRVLHNGQEISLPHMKPGRVCTLEDFEATYFRPFIVSKEEHEDLCAVTFGHEQPAGSGDAVQGV